MEFRRKLPGPWSTMWSQQYLSAMHPMTCSLLWVRCLVDRFSILGQMTPKWKHFQICFSGFCDGTPNYVSWSNLVKIGRCKVAERLHGLPKKLGLCGTRPNRHFCQNGPIVLKIPWTLSPVYMSMCTNFGPDRLRFAGLIPERLIFCPKSQYNIGFQPIIINV